MKYRALTISREYGSGGGEIADLVAKELGWKLLDKDLIAEISKTEKVSPSEVAAFDEKVDPWIHRITRTVWGLGADGISVVAPVDMFDAEKAASLAKRIVIEAYNMGNCVIVGRGSQCILRNKRDVFHAFVYARLEDRVRKIQKGVKAGTDVPALIRATDAQRVEYIRVHYKEKWMNPYLYDIMIDSKNENEKTARLILSAMQMVSEPEPK
ncbi:MAG TPA: cytidylate kinase-like family protein [Acidobacteriota bacterium]|nr:cytidylate kinase-like family protein [Acidobacteriota bacterium]